MAELENNLLSTKGKLFVNRHKKPYEYLFVHKIGLRELDFCVYFNRHISDNFTAYKLTRIEMPSLDIFRNELLDNDDNTDGDNDATETSSVWSEITHIDSLVPSSWRRIVSEIEKQINE